MTEVVVGGGASPLYDAGRLWPAGFEPGTFRLGVEHHTILFVDLIYFGEDPFYNDTKSSN